MLYLVLFSALVAFCNILKLLFLETKKTESKKDNLTFHSKSDVVELFGYIITNSMFYTTDSESKFPFTINKKSKPNFKYTELNKLGYYPNYNQLSNEQQAYFIQWLANKKPFIEDLGYVYMYYYGLEYRALVKKQDLKDVLFEVIELLNKFKKLKYGYSFIIYLIFLIKNFSKNESNILLNFLKNNEMKFGDEYYSAVKILTLSKQDFKINFSLYQLSDYNDYEFYINKRENELLSYYFDNIIEKLNKSEIYETVSKNYKYYTCLRAFLNINEFDYFLSIKYDAILPSLKIKQLWKNGCQIIKNEVKKPINKFNISSEPLTEIEKLVYLPEKLRSEIKIPECLLDFRDGVITTIDVVASKLGFEIMNKITLRQVNIISDACEIFGYKLFPELDKNKELYEKIKNNFSIIIYKNKNQLNFLLPKFKNEYVDKTVLIKKSNQVEKKGSKIPANIEINEKNELNLNTEKLEKIKANTLEIHNVLQKIFIDKDLEVSEVKYTEYSAKITSFERVQKVEVKNDLQNIINILIKKEKWTYNELFNIIKNKGLMLNNIIDEINEWSDEEFGDFLVEEDDDTYTINGDIVNLIKNRK